MRDLCDDMGTTYFTSAPDAQNTIRDFHAGMSGSIVISSLSSEDIVSIIRHKAKHEGLYEIDLANIKQRPLPHSVPPSCGHTLYCEVGLGWKDGKGFRSIIDLLKDLRGVP